MKTYKLLILMVFFLSACGFQPLYKVTENGDVMCFFDQVHIPKAKDRSHQILKQALLHRFNASDTETKYRLDLTIEEHKAELGIEQDDSATLAKLTLITTYSLYNPKGLKIFESSSRSVNSYNILKSPYATLSAEKNARKRGIQMIAKDIIQSLAIYYDQNKKKIKVCKS